MMFHFPHAYILFQDHHCPARLGQNECSVGKRSKKGMPIKVYAGEPIYSRNIYGGSLPKVNLYKDYKDLAQGKEHTLTLGPQTPAQCSRISQETDQGGQLWTAIPTISGNGKTEAEGLHVPRPKNNSHVGRKTSEQKYLVTEGSPSQF